MANHSTDDIYQQVGKIQKTLDAGKGVASQQYIDGKFKEAKEDPTQLESWSKSLGLGLEDIVKSIQDFKISSLAAWSAVGVAITTFTISNLIDKDALITEVLRRKGYERNDFGIPRKKQAQPATQPPAAVPVTNIDADRLKGMRSASLALTRSLSDLHKEAQRVAAGLA